MKKLLQKWLGITELQSKIEEFENPQTFMAVDLGYIEGTIVVVTRKDISGRFDQFKTTINLPPLNESGDVQDQIIDLMVEYGIKTNNVKIDAHPGFKKHLVHVARERGLK